MLNFVVNLADKNCVFYTNVTADEHEHKKIRRKFREVDNLPVTTAAAFY